MTLTATHLRALEASAQAAALSTQALLGQIAALRAAMKQQLEETPAIEIPQTCPKCGCGTEFLMPTSDGRHACRSCKTIF